MSETPPPEAPPLPPRNPVGWLALGFLLLVTAYSLVSGFASARHTSLEYRWSETLRSKLVTREIDARLGRANDSGWFRRSERQLAPYRKTPEWAAYWIAIRTELHEPVTRDEIRVIAGSKSPKLRDIGAAYALRPAPAVQAAALARTLDARDALSRLAATHLREAAGLVPGARAWIGKAADHYLLAAGLYAVVGSASLLAWIALFVVGGSGGLRPLGPPYVAPNPGDADRLGVRAALLFFGFEVVSLLFAKLHASMPVKSIGAGLAMFVVVPLVLRRQPSFEEIVRAREGFGRKLLLGLWAFLLEIPVTMVMALVGTRLFHGLPENEHPASAALMNAPDLATIAAVLFFGAVAAPFWEETMFRGLLLPGLRRVLNRPAAAALLSSFLFACIHPQGPGGWLGLMAFALGSCVLVNGTRSLVPSMVMHAAHNATLLTVAILIGN